MPNTPISTKQKILTLISQGNAEKAEKLVNERLKSEPESLTNWELLIFLLHHKKQYDKAIEVCQKILEEKPNNRSVRNNLGTCLMAKGKLAEAIEQFNQLLEAPHSSPETWCNLGTCHFQLKQFKRAANAFLRTLKLRPTYYKANLYLAKTFESIKRHDEAIGYFQNAIKLNSKAIEPLNALANVYKKQGHFEKSIATYRKAIEIDPKNCAPYTNLGNIERIKGNFEESLRLQKKSIELSDKNAYVYNNLAITYKELGRLDQATSNFQKALELNPDYKFINLSLGIIDLTQGDYLKGWPGYEYRRGEAPNFYNKFDESKEWHGENLEGKSILIHAEQGIGDAFQYLRFLDHPAFDNADVHFSLRPGLIRICSSFPRNVTFHSREALNPVQYDYYAYHMSITGILGISLDQVDLNSPYLKPSSQKVEDWKAKLGSDGFKIGINWQGNSEGKIDEGRSIPLSKFAPLCSIPGVRLISLQKEGGIDQLDALPEGMTVESLGDDFDSGPDSFIDTAAIMKCLDLTITSDTSIAHLAGALGAPTWVAIKKIPDWRWGLDSDDSPWYPSIRLFRQSSPRDWDSAIQKMETALHEMLDAPNNSLANAVSAANAIEPE